VPARWALDTDSTVRALSLLLRVLIITGIKYNLIIKFII
jgi:hypothetical protein